MTQTVDWSGDRGKLWRDELQRLEAMLAPVTLPVIDALDLEAPVRIADIGCGGGATTYDIAARAPGGSEITGFDISPDLIAAAKQKPADKRNPVRFEVRDAQAPTTNPGMFDRITSRFGIMFFSDPKQAFRNLHDWLAPGGAFAFAIWGPPSDNPWMAQMRGVLGKYMELPSPDPDAPGPFRYQDAEAFKALLVESGFTGVENHSWREPLAVGGGLNAADTADFALSAFSLGQEFDSTAPAETKEAMRADLAQLFSDHLVDGRVEMASHVHIITGAA